MRQDFGIFTQVSLRIQLSSEAPKRLPWHVDIMADSVQQLYRGDIRRLIVNLPPRHLKSIVMTVTQIAWWIGKSPGANIMLVCYGQSLAEDLLRRVKDVIAHPWYQRAFPAVCIGRVNSAHRLETTRGGRIFATSLGGVFTGMGADLIVVDDPLKAQDALSDARRARANQTFDEALLSRLNDPGEGRVVVVMQRLHEDDLAGHLLRRGGWTHIHVPIVAEESIIYPRAEAMAMRRLPGHIIDAQRTPLPVIDELRRTVGGVIFEAQYQQNPQPAAGLFLPLDNLGIYNEPLPLEAYDALAVGCDTAMAVGDDNDYTACVVIGRHGPHIHVLNCIQGRIPFNEQLLLLRQLYHAYPGIHLVIENAGQGIPLAQELRREFGMSPILAAVRLNKVQRAAEIIPQLENGYVFLPALAEWTEPFLNELRAFPYGRHDDRVDALVHAIRYLNRLNRLERPHQRPAPSRPQGGRRRPGSLR
jgi:predicted phage terminase large subunit-like protein